MSTVYVVLPFSFLRGIISALSGWLIQGSNMDKKGCERVSWSCLLFKNKANQKTLPISPPYWVAAITCSPYTSFESPLKAHKLWATEILCSWSVSNTICECEGKELWVTPLLMQMFHCPIRLDRQKRSSVKIFRIAKWSQQFIKPDVGSFDCTGLWSQSQPWSASYYLGKHWTLRLSTFIPTKLMKE